MASSRPSISANPRVQSPVNRPIIVPRWMSVFCLTKIMKCTWSGITTLSMIEQCGNFEGIAETHRLTISPVGVRTTRTGAEVSRILPAREERIGVFSSFTTVII